MQEHTNTHHAPRPFINKTWADGGVEKRGNHGACGIFNIEVGQEYYFFFFSATRSRHFGICVWLLMPINYIIFNTHVSLGIV